MTLRYAPVACGALLVGAAMLFRPPAVPAADPPPVASAAPPAAPDEDLLGTVEVNGSAGGLPPLPKLAVVPIVTTGSADSVVNLVVRRDMELSGQFEVLDDGMAPAGPFTHDSPLDLDAWRSSGAEYVLRVVAEPAPNDSIRTQLVGEAYVTPRKVRGPNAPAQDAKAAFRTAIVTATTEVRAASHRLVDRLLGGLTGRPGGFASQMVYTEKVGRWRRIFGLDADGFNLHAIGPDGATAVSPAFGPGGQIYYALSVDYDPFRLVFGPNAEPVPLPVPGSILGVAFSADRQKMALTVISQGQSRLWIGPRGDLHAVDTPPLANHPIFGPLGKTAYVAGIPVQRVYLDGKAVSPPGFVASAPVFCDTPEGLLVVYTVGVGAGADIIATDTSGGNLRRLTQHEGANTDAACSPDGRLVAFFSTGKKAREPSHGAAAPEGAGLFIMPIARPWLAKKISSETGESLRWAPIAPNASD